MSEASEVNDQIVLACEVPETATPGSTFHVQLEDRFFEVLTPEGAVPGQTIHIVVSNETKTDVAVSAIEEETIGADTKVVHVAEAAGHEGIFGSLKFLSDQAINKAKEIDATYKITDKIVDIATPAVEQLKVVDSKYKVSEKATAAGAQAMETIQKIDSKYEISARTQALIKTTYESAVKVDEDHKITERATHVGEQVVAYAREIDARYAVSAQAATLVSAGANAITSAYNRAIAYDKEHHYSERTAAAFTAGASAVVDRLSSKPAVTAEATAVPLAEVKETVAEAATESTAVAPSTTL